MPKLLQAAMVSVALAASTVALAQTTTPSRPGTSPGSSMQPQWHRAQAGEIRASRLIGTTVRNNAGDTIGEINELVLGKDGKVAAVVIGVGGFLGLGEREVAVEFKSLNLSQDTNQRTVAKLDADKDALKAAPEWKWSGEGRSGTTGVGTKPPER